MSGATGDTIPARRRRIRPLVVLLVLVGIWLGAGILRAETVARSYWASSTARGATLANVRVTFESPFIPPFWWVSLDGEVKEAQMTGPGYDSAMLLIVEPVTGLVFVFGRG